MAGVPREAAGAEGGLFGLPRPRDGPVGAAFDAGGGDRAAPSRSELSDTQVTIRVRRRSSPGRGAAPEGPPERPPAAAERPRGGLPPSEDSGGVRNAGLKDGKSARDLRWEQRRQQHQLQQVMRVTVKHRDRHEAGDADASKASQETPSTGINSGEAVPTPLRQGQVAHPGRSSPTGGAVRRAASEGLAAPRAQQPKKPASGSSGSVFPPAREPDAALWAAPRLPRRPEGRPPEGCLPEGRPDEKRPGLDGQRPEALAGVPGRQRPASAAAAHRRRASGGGSGADMCRYDIITGRWLEG